MTSNTDTQNSDMDALEASMSASEESVGSAHPERRVTLLAFTLAVVAVSLVLTLPDVGVAQVSAPWWLLPVLTVGFALAEFSVFRFIFRRESLAFSLSEIPLALSLVYLAPGAAMTARVVGAMAVILIIRRPPAYKVAFNTGMLLFEVAVAVLVFQGIVDLWGNGGSHYVVAAIVSLIVCGVVSSIIVSLAISQFEGNLLSRIASELRVAWWLFLVNSTLAGMVLALALISPYLVLVALIPVGLLWFIIKAYGALDQRLRDLDAVHGFTGQVGRSLDPDEIMRAAALETAEVLRTDGTAVIVFDERNGATLKVHGVLGLQLPTDADDPSWRALINSERAVLVPRADLGAMRPADSRITEMMVAPMRDESGVMGMLVVAGRTGASRRFQADDLVRLQNLTEQLAVSLRKGMLHQRIEREARLDGLTGLPNRVSFEKSLESTASNRLQGQMLFVVMLDLDRFKEVNDTLGHHAGDQLLIEAAERMRILLAPAMCLPDSPATSSPSSDSDAPATRCSSSHGPVCEMSVARSPWTVSRSWSPPALDLRSSTRTSRKAHRFAMRTSPCSTPRPSGSVWRCTATKSTVGRPLASRCWATCARRSRTNSSTCTSSRSSISTREWSSAPRRWCAGRTRCAASCRPHSSCVLPRTPA